MNYPDLPRSGLPGPRLLRSGSSERPKVSRDHERRYAPFERLPVSVSELASDVDTEVPDSAGGFPSQAVRSVPLLPVGHSATTAGARFLSSFERAMLSRDDETASPFRTTFERRRRRGEHRVTLFDPRVVNVAETVFASRAGAVSPPYSAPSGRSVEEGGLAPSLQKVNCISAGAISSRNLPVDFTGNPVCSDSESGLLILPTVLTRSAKPG